MANQIRTPFGSFKEEHAMYPESKTFTHSLLLEIPATENDERNGKIPTSQKITSLNIHKIIVDR